MPGERLSYTKNDIDGIQYHKPTGPVARDVVADPNFKPDRVNCQGAMQLFYARVMAIYLGPEMALSEEGYNNTGIPVAETDPFSKGQERFFESLQFGDIIYSIPRKKLGKLDVTNNKDQRDFHISVAIRRSNKTNPIINMFFQEMGLPDGDFVFHATQNGGKNMSCVETVDEYLKKYAPIRANRLVSLPDYEAYFTASLPS